MSVLPDPRSALRTPQSWRLKSLRRLIVTSAVYRQATLRRTSGDASLKAVEADPDNTLFRHFPRKRLSAEKVRDALLAVSGDLNAAMYGPGVCPPLPAGYNGREAWPLSPHRRDHVRRSVYVLAKRNLPYPLLHAFDLPDMHESCACRAHTTTAPQALMLLNGDLVRDASQRLAARVREAAGSEDPPAVVRSAFSIALGRPPSSDEERTAIGFLDRQRRLSSLDHAMPARPEGPAFAETGREPFETSLADLCHVLLNLNEFLYLE